MRFWANHEQRERRNGGRTVPARGVHLRRRRLSGHARHPAHTAGGAAKAAVPPGRDVLTLELKVNFLRPGRGDRLVARGRVLRAGRTSVVSESEVFAVADGEEQLIAKLMSTLTVFDQRPLAR